MELENSYKTYSEDVRYIKVDEKEIIIVGTAHISKQSADLVKEVIENEMPDTVCIELDEKRYKSLSEKKKWEELDLKELIKQKQLSTLLINILLASYQKKLGEKLGVSPGLELLEAAQSADRLNIPIELCDRDVRITLKRAWNSMTFWQKLKFMTSGLAGIFDDEAITEEKLNEIKQKDVLSELMNELGKTLPILKKVLIDERDVYLAEKIRRAKGNKIVAVVGAGHVSGMLEILKENKARELDSIEQIPPASPVIKIIGWLIPAFFRHGFREWTSWIGILGLTFGLISPRLLYYPYKGWMALGHALGWINSHIILGLVFILVLQPIAYIMRLTGYDPLRRRRKGEATYRENRKDHKTDLTRIF